jgi:hypothetical protein
MHGLYSTEDKITADDEMERSHGNFKVLPEYLPGRTGKNQKYLSE